MVSIFSIVGGRFKNYCNKISSSKTAIDEKFVVSNSTEIFVTFGVPVPYLYRMGIIEFFHRLNLHNFGVTPGPLPPYDSTVLHR